MLNAPPDLPWYRPRLDYVAYTLWMIFGVVLALRIALRTDGYFGVFGGYHEATLCWRASAEVYEANHAFVYPPFALLLLTPFSFAGEQFGGVLWRMFNFAAYYGAILWALRACFPGRLNRLARAAFLLILIVPSIGALNLGQVNPLIFGLLLGSAVAASQGRYRLAAFLAAPPVGLKIYPVAFGLLLGALRPRRFLPWFLLAVCIVFALPYVFKDAAYINQLHHDFIARLAADEREGVMRFRDFRLILEAVGLPLSDHANLALGAAAGVGVLALSLWVRNLGYVFAFSCCWITLFGPATEKATYIFVAPVFCWILVESRRRREFRVLLPAFLLYMYPLTPIGKLLRSPSARLALPLSTTILFGLLVVRALKSRPVPSAAPRT